MRIFNREAKKCENISFTYNPNRPEAGVQIHLGIGEDKKCPGCSEQEIAYVDIEVNELEMLIAELQSIRDEYEISGE